MNFADIQMLIKNRFFCSSFEGIAMVKLQETRYVPWIGL